MTECNSSSKNLTTGRRTKSCIVTIDPAKTELGPDQSVLLSWEEWGAEDNPDIIICAHGLTRRGRDFDVLAAELAKTHRVLCPDFPGRGNSGWLAAAIHYAYGYYIPLLAHWLSQLNITKVQWVGTSMGGLSGMMLGATFPGLISKMVLNDVGPQVPSQGMLRIVEAFLGAERKLPDLVFADLAAARAYMAKALASFGPLTADQLDFMTEISVRNAPERNGLVLHFDPELFAPLQSWQPIAPSGYIVDLRHGVWDKLTCPVLVLNGQWSDILLRKDIETMIQSGPKTTVITVPNCGHAPALLDADQVGLVAGWLRS